MPVRRSIRARTPSVRLNPLPEAAAARSLCPRENMVFTGEATNAEEGAMPGRESVHGPLKVSRPLPPPGASDPLTPGSVDNVIVARGEGSAWQGEPPVTTGI